MVKLNKSKKGSSMCSNPIINVSSLFSNNLSIFNEVSNLISFEKSEKLFTQNHSANTIVLILDGFVKLSQVENKNATKYIQPMQLISDSLPNEKEEYSFSAHAMTQGRALVINYNLFKEKIFWSPKLSLAIIQLLHKSEQQISKEIENQRVFSAMQRVVMFILKYKPLIAQLKHKDMAELLFLTPETFSRQIGKLKEKKYITMKKLEISLNEDKLKSLLV